MRSLLAEKMVGSMGRRILDGLTGDITEFQPKIRLTLGNRNDIVDSLLKKTSFSCIHYTIG